MSARNWCVMYFCICLPVWVTGLRLACIFGHAHLIIICMTGPRVWLQYVFFNGSSEW